MYRVTLLNFVDQAQYVSLIYSLKAKAFLVYTLDSVKVHDKLSFMTRSQTDLPLAEPPWLGEPRYTDNWDSYADLLWQGFDSLSDKSIAIMWTDAQNMLDGSLETPLLAVDIFQSSFKSIRDAQGKQPKFNLLIFLMGSGPNFPTVSLPLEFWRAYFPSERTPI